ncbi:MAG: hypothetical protein A3B74_01190 [Candidatus Kerfeldbacteria bacterium RIFCSPHIGHO2_02_FULL_42_14]|uniref:Uncharacterized protein n=1 Tax=Candidatus Kerfeldbacteria bacterium RIFCSPHIGHO2_02_FULL_42_14 TaxID=1798540 RepID=A0A1G2ASF9_9BACT|nr:MAG: hypothetical protein A3B74_01190 [Candidatus Kerfeldbacteria bacterium RIFCSPHIGHO2_02_FULL_42_14]OGY81965.1 MAG: hypothetical protein A3E60_01275 [Candidatus Kerfeldbacteria bacterium RIFCSPHIGHO2_12_FULL_42_13]OGY83401.1 MAG: hypothetical protein A3I91_01985 [Candidatus Kerfeldbacteria bacterium RIFCSPLOWO2_02_FULL_42_19]OGY85589.1 MAG: hypothetical protein A3G01_03840 [Candidatus Kerfeldbacteria bacterium RIFCSPLOWO2_12_FULL_43_9]
MYWLYFAVSFILAPKFSGFKLRWSTDQGAMIERVLLKSQATISFPFESSLIQFGCWLQKSQ